LCRLDQRSSIQVHSWLTEAIWAAVSAAPVAPLVLLPDVAGSAVVVLAVVLVSAPVVAVPVVSVPVVPLAMVSVPVVAEPVVSVPVVELEPEAIVSVPVVAEPLVSVPVVGAVPLAIVSVPVVAEPVVPVPVVELEPEAIVSVPVVAEPVASVPVAEPLVPALAVMVEQSARTSACCSAVREAQAVLTSSSVFKVPASKSLKNAPVMVVSQSGTPELIPVEGVVVVAVPVVELAPLSV
jgi:hypothetical protein